MRQWNSRNIEMRLDEFAGARNGDVGVGIDGHGLRPLFASWLAVLARRGVRVFVPDRHYSLRCHHPRRRMIQ